MATLLIDGDIVLFQIAFRSQYKMFDTLFVDNIKIAQERIDNFIQDLLNATETKEYLVCLSGFNNFRKQLTPTYKINRADKEKPELLSELRAYMETSHPNLYANNLEADDVMKILVSEGKTDYIVASLDKDLKQIPTTHYNWNKKWLFTMSPEESELFFYSQVLQGDPGDGYFGVPGIGKIKAVKILAPIKPSEYWHVVVKTYIEHGLKYEDALLNARLAFILDKDHYDWDTEQVKLWEPPYKRVEI